MAKKNILEMNIFQADHPFNLTRKIINSLGEEGLLNKTGIKWDIHIGYTSRLVREVPRGHDLYLLHLGNLRGDDFKHLRQEQPWSRIIGISYGAGGNYDEAFRSTSYKNHFDKVYYEGLYLKDIKRELILTAEKIMSPEK